MKLTKLTAAVIAASTAIIPFTAGTSDLFTPLNAYSEETADVSSFPDWIPQSFNDAVHFRNKYGAVHIGDENDSYPFYDSDLLCVVFQEPSYSTKKYDIKNTGGLVTVFYHNIFVDEETDTAYEVMTYKNAATSKPDFKLQFICDSELQKEYSFTSFGTQVVETDIYSWLPDCYEEYRVYELTYSNVSVKEDYLVLCFDSTAGTAFDWYPTPSNDHDRSVIDYVMTEYCNEETPELLDGGEQHRIEVYQAKKDGMAKILYDYVANYGKPYLPEEVEKTMVADCAIVNNAQNILLPGNMKVTVVDYETGKPLTIAENSMLSVWTDIRYYTPEGDMSTGPVYEIWTNPTIIDGLWNYSNADHFAFRLGDYGIPEGYAAPDNKGFVVYSKGSILPDHMSVTEYENGSADVVFKLKKDTKRVIPEEKSADLTDLKKGETRITIYDKDTGELIPNDLLEHHYCGFGTDIRFKKPNVPGGWIMTGPIYVVESNPQVYQTDLAKLYRSADIFEFLCDDQPEVTLYDNGAMDLVIRTKIKVSGNINGDSKFNIADLVALQKWLLNAYDKELYNWAEADFDLDNKLTVFDLVLMRKALLKSINLPVEVSVTESGGVTGAMIIYKVYCEYDKYFLSYQDLTSDQEPKSIVIQISEQEYREIMAQDYDSMMQNMNNPDGPGWSEIECVLELGYSDGSKIKAVSERMPGVMTKLRELKEKYSTYVKPDESFEYGVPFFVLEDGLKLYLGPDERYNTIACIPADTRLIEKGAQDNNNEWLFTEYNSQYGWIKVFKEDDKTPTIYFEQIAKKPVIYLYPEQETDVHVELELTEAELSTTYPKYNNGWNVTAYPDGKLVNKADGTHHRYLFWDAVNCRTRFDFSKGFCVAGSNTESFLKEKLKYMGLTENEMNEFIVYWLPLLEHNKYNLISFQSDVYTDSAKLNISPAPDSMLRVFMTYVPLEEAIDIEPQKLSTFERNGFTVVEWGGSKIQ